MTDREKKALEQMEEKAMEIAKEVLRSGKSEAFAAMAVGEKFAFPPVDPAVMVFRAVIELRQEGLKLEVSPETEKKVEDTMRQALERDTPDGSAV